MKDIAIGVEHLSKQYRIGANQESYKTLRDTITEMLTGPFHRLSSVIRGEASVISSETFWALKDISLEFNRGELIGIIGRNGAGKSTLLKILSRITEPTQGRVRIRGRVGSLLEVGTGFHPELTGRENVYLNGALLGMKRAEIEHKFEEIVAFSEVEKFIDTPVKHYSSGMYLRLAFAVAAHLEPEILLVDEVLAVGDASFQKKCLGKMGAVAEAGRTVVFVSHNMGAIAGLCERAIWIDGGIVAADGPVDEVTQAYLHTLSDGSFNYYNKTYELGIRSVVLKNSKGEIPSQFYPGEDLLVEICFEANKRVEKPLIWLKIESLHGPCFTANMLLDGHRPQALEGRAALSCKFKSIPLLPQSYTIFLCVRTSNKDIIVAPQEIASFTVSGNLEDYGYKGEFHAYASASTPVVVPYEWTLPDGSMASVDLSRSRLSNE